MLNHLGEPEKIKDLSVVMIARIIEREKRAMEIAEKKDVRS